MLYEVITDALGGRRLDQALAEMLPQYSRNRLQSWVKDGCVTVDGEPALEPKRKLLGGEQLLLALPDDEFVDAEQAEEIPLSYNFV